MYKLQYEYIDEYDDYIDTEINREKKYAILDHSREYSVISLSRLKKDGIDINNLTYKSIYMPKEGKVVVKVDLNLAIGKEEFQEKISVILSEESKEEFYLGKDFLSFYSIKKIGDTTKRYLVETEGNENFYISIEEYERTPKKWLNTFIISLIVAISAIIIFFLTSSIIDENVSTELLLFDKTGDSSGFNFSEFVMHAEELGHEIGSIKLPSKEITKQNIVKCNILANKFDRIIPQLMENLNDFSSRLEIARNSYASIYADGTLVFWTFEKCIEKILNYISNESLIIYIHRKIDSNEEMALSRSIEKLIDALGTFDSSVKYAHETTLTAESFRAGTHIQFIEARSDINRSAWSKISNYINPTIDDETEDFMKNIFDDLKGIANDLFDFKENLEKYSNEFRKLLANTKSLKRLKWDEHEIKKTKELLNMIKENRINFKSKSNQ